MYLSEESLCGFALWVDSRCAVPKIYDCERLIYFDLIAEILI